MVVNHQVNFDFISRALGDCPSAIFSAICMEVRSLVIFYFCLDSTLSFIWKVWDSRASLHCVEIYLVWRIVPLGGFYLLFVNNSLVFNVVSAI